MPNEQMDLIDVSPENSKGIIACAKRYKTAQATRIAALNDEKAEKHNLLELIEKEHLSRTEEGKIQFTVDGMTITVTPRDELVQVKEEDSDDED